MTIARRQLGTFGEDLAAQYLEGQGFRIVARNVRLRGGELDIVAWDGPVLVFVEVRSRRGGRMGLPEESVDARKRRRLTALALAYLQLNRIRGVNCRFDVVGIEWSYDRDAPRIHHIPNAFSL